jgi:hypothetical protein
MRAPRRAGARARSLPLRLQVAALPPRLIAARDQHDFAAHIPRKFRHKNNPSL